MKTEIGANETVFILYQLYNNYVAKRNVNVKILLILKVQKKLILHFTHTGHINMCMHCEHTHNGRYKTSLMKETV